MGKTYGGVLPNRGNPDSGQCRFKPFPFYGVFPQLEIILADFVLTLEKKTVSYRNLDGPWEIGSRFVSGNVIERPVNQYLERRSVASGGLHQA